MQTKYTTGQAVLIPATIRNASEVNGQIIYNVDADPWEGIPENAIVIDQNASARANFDAAFRELNNNLRADFR